MPAPLGIIAPASSLDRPRELIQLGHLHLASHAPAVDHRHDLRELLRRIRREDEALADAPPIDAPGPVGELGWEIRIFVRVSIAIGRR
jgi:hypothetical protein